MRWIWLAVVVTVALAACDSPGAGDDGPGWRDCQPALEGDDYTWLAEGLGAQSWVAAATKAELDDGCTVSQVLDGDGCGTVIHVRAGEGDPCRCLEHGPVYDEDDRPLTECGDPEGGWPPCQLWWTEAGCLDG